MEHIGTIIDRSITKMIEKNGQKAMIEAEAAADLLKLRIIEGDQDPNDPEEWDEVLIFNPGKIFDDYPNGFMKQ